MVRMTLPGCKSRLFSPLCSAPDCTTGRAWVLAGLLALHYGVIGANGAHGAEATEGPAPSDTPASQAVPEAAEGGIESLPLDDRLALSARWDLGYYLFQIQEYPAAAAEFEKIRAVLPREAALLALIGSCYSMSGRWQEGETNLLQARELDPSDADVNGLLGQFYLTQGKGLKGAFFLEHALKAAPELVDLRISLADIYLDAGQAAKARGHLEILLAERGGEEFGDPRLEHAYARVLVLAGAFREAMPFAQRAHQAQPAHPAYARTLGLCLLGMGRYAEAARMLAAGRGTGASESDAELHLQLGEALFLDRRWEPAEDAWLAGISRFPGYFPLYARLIDYYLGTTRPIQASRVVDFARKRNPDHPGNQLLDARFHRKLGDFAAARKAVTRLKRQAAGRMAADALWEEALIEYESGRFATCRRILDRLLAMGKGDPSTRPAEAHLLKARMALRNGDLAAAQASILEARAANPYELKVYSLARQAFARPEDQGRLAEMMRDALDLMPGSEFLFSQVTRN